MYINDPGSWSMVLLDQNAGWEVVSVFSALNRVKQLTNSRMHSIRNNHSKQRAYFSFVGLQLPRGCKYISASYLSNTFHVTNGFVIVEQMR